MQIPQSGRSKTGQRKKCKADWIDIDGDRHRKFFLTPEEAESYQRTMVAEVRLLKLSRELGQGIRSSAGDRDRDREIRRLLRECSRITSLVAVGKKAPESISLGEQGRLAL